MDQLFKDAESNVSGMIQDHIFSQEAEKAMLFKQYYETTLNLKRSIEKHDDPEVKTLLRKRHKIINTIDGIDKSINASTKDMSGEKTKHLKTSDLERKNNLKNDLKGLLKNISILEDECMILLKNESNTIKKTVLNTRIKKKRQMHYQGFGSATAKFVDTKIT